MCDQVAADSWAELEAEAFRTNERAENEAPRVEAGSRETLPEANVLTARELLIEERETLLQSRADYARSGGRIVAGGLIGLLGLGAATGVIAGRDALTLRYEVQRADGSMAQETSYALVTGLLLTAGLIALTGLSIFINGIHRRRMRHVTYRRLRRLDEQLHATDSPN